MKYRTTLNIAMVIISIASSLLAVSIFYEEIESRVVLQLKTKVASVAATTASLLDHRELKNIQTLADEKSPAYAKIVKQLRLARDANRQHEIYIKYLYLLRPHPTDPQKLIFIADAEENPKDISHTGDTYTLHEKNEQIELTKHLNQVYNPQQFIKDNWGVWMSGFAPIYDKQGKYVATVGADISAMDITKERNLILLYAAFSFLVSILLSLLIAYFLSKRVTKHLSELCKSVNEIGKGNLKHRTIIKTHDEFNELASEINDMAQKLEERERLKQGFTRYVSQQILEKILASDTPLKLEGERRKVTILFSDIRNFTHLAESLSPEKVVSLLNEYLSIMLDIIFKHQGTLDKFLGDGMMVEFGALLPDEKQELHAIEAAIEMQNELKNLRARWEKENKPPIQIGIGIHTGTVIVGNIGSEQRMEYTAIGDAVNVASHIQNSTKEFKVPILISETTYQSVKDKFACEDLGEIFLKGRVEAIRVYKIL
jgi:adenylate cyclase